MSDDLGDDIPPLSHRAARYGGADDIHRLLKDGGEVEVLTSAEAYEDVRSVENNILGPVIGSPVPSFSGRGSPQ